MLYNGITIKSERQAFSPSAESLKTIEDCADDLSPKEQALSEWHNTYVSNHKERIALDLDLTKEQVKQKAKVLEIGSIPLLFTTALSRSNYDVTGCDIAPDRYT